VENRRLRTVILTICILVVLFFVFFVAIKIYKEEKPRIFDESEQTLEEETIKESTSEEFSISEESEQISQEETTNETADETIEENEGVMSDAYPLFEHQGIVLEIDYEKYIITIENANTGEIEELDCYRIIEKYGGDESALDVFYHFLNPPLNPLTGGYKLLEDANFKDIKKGYYVAAYTTKDAGKSAIEFWEDDNLILIIYFSEERWW
jgi:hypothetical protein